MLGQHSRMAAEIAAWNSRMYAKRCAQSFVESASRRCQKTTLSWGLMNVKRPIAFAVWPPTHLSLWLPPSQRGRAEARCVFGLGPRSRPCRTFACARRTLPARPALLPRPQLRARAHAFPRDVIRIGCSCRSHDAAAHASVNGWVVDWVRGRVPPPFTRRPYLARFRLHFAQRAHPTGHRAVCRPLRALTERSDCNEMGERRRASFVASALTGTDRDRFDAERPRPSLTNCFDRFCRRCCHTPLSRSLATIKR